MKKCSFAVLVTTLFASGTTAFASPLSCTEVETGKQKLSIDLLGGISSVNLTDGENFQFLGWSSAKSEKTSYFSHKYEFILESAEKQTNTLTIVKTTIFTRGGCTGRGGCDFAASIDSKTSALLQLGDKTLEFDCNE